VSTHLLLFLAAQDGKVVEVVQGVQAPRLTELVTKLMPAKAV
jgi:hypothetical protein